MTTESPASGAPGARGRRAVPHNVWAISLTSLFSDWSYEMLLPVLPFFLVLDLGASPLVIGAIEGAAIFAQSAVQFLSGSRLTRRRDRRRVGAAGYATTTAAHGLLAAASAWPYVAVLRVTAWSARGERQPIKKAILSDAAASLGAGRSFGLEQTFDSLGAIVGTAETVVLLTTGGLAAFRTIFAVSVIPGAIAVLLFYRLVRDREVGTGAPTSLRSGTSAPPAAFPRAFRRFLLASGVFGLAFFNILLGLLRVGTGLIGPNGPGPVGGILLAIVAYLVYNLVYAGFSYPAGILADRFPRIGLVALSYLLFVPVDALFILTPSVVVAFLAFLAAGVQIAFLDVGESAWISRAVGADSVGRAFGWFGGIRGVTSLVSSTLVGALWTFYNPELAFSVSAVFALAGAVLLLTLPAGGPRAGTEGTPG